MNKYSFDADILVIGAGVVGLAIAREMANRGFSIIIVEKNRSAGSGISSRNSEVIHAGIYYPNNSLKAKLCIEGNKKLYQYCEKNNIPHSRCGKLIVATSTNELLDLDKLYKNAKNNGLNDINFLAKKELIKIEPELECVNALYSPSSGVIDSHILIQTILGEIQNTGCTIAFNSTVTNIYPEKNGLNTEVLGNSEKVIIHSKAVINCGGLDSQNIARSIKGLRPEFIPEQYLAKGTYFTTNKKPPFSHLIYPIPEKQGLGIHLTLDLSGKAKYGPDIEWIQVEEYSTNIDKRKLYYNQIKKFWPKIDEESLIPDYAGIRPKLSGPDDEAEDFIIQFPEKHNITGLVNLFGIESPGLTSCLSIASEISSRIDNLL